MEMEMEIKFITIVTVFYFLALGVVYKLIWEYVFMSAKKERKYMSSCLIMILVLFFFSSFIYWTIQYNLPEGSTIIAFIKKIFTSTIEAVKAGKWELVHIKIWIFLYFVIAPIGLIIKDIKRKTIRIKHLRKINI